MPRQSNVRSIINRSLILGVGMTLLGTLGIEPSLASPAYCETISDNLVVDCSFENNSPVWIFTGSAGRHQRDGGDPAYSGDVEVIINRFSPGHGNFYQDITTIPGHTYEITFFIASNGGDAQVYGQFGGNGTYSQYFGGISPPLTGFLTYLEQSFSYTVSGTSTPISLEAWGLTGTVFIDDIIVRDTSIPEPATATLLATCLAGFARLRSGGLCRRQRSQRATGIVQMRSRDNSVD